MAKTVEPFHPPDAAERDSKSVSRRSCAVGLTSPMGRCAKASRRREARRLGRETDEPFAQMESAGIAVPSALNKRAIGFSVRR